MFSNYSISKYCNIGNKKWNVTLSDIVYYNDYIRCFINCNGNTFKTYLGISDYELWICFPDIEKSTTLSNIDDVLWNENELYRVLKNKTDAISIAQAITCLKEFFV